MPKKPAKTPAIVPVNVYVEVVTHTPGGRHVHIVYHGLDVHSGPLGQSCRHVVTQDALADRAPAKIRKVVGDYWGDAEIDAEVLDHLAASGIVAVIVPNPAVVEREQIAVDQKRIGAARRRSALSRKKSRL